MCFFVFFYTIIFHIENKWGGQPKKKEGNSQLFAPKEGQNGLYFKIRGNSQQKTSQVREHGEERVKREIRKKKTGMKK